MTYLCATTAIDKGREFNTMLQKDLFPRQICLINLPPAQVASPAPPFELVTFGGEGYNKDSLKARPTLLVSPTTLG
jgi:hypothetical protein